METSERERQHLGQELHNTLCQSLSGLTFLVEVLLRRARAGKPVDLAQLEKLGETLRFATDETHLLRRKLQLQRLDAVGLTTALQELALDTARHVPCEFRAGELPETLDAATVLALFRIAEEAVGNTLQHAEATGIVIALGAEKGRLVLSISDDGSGFTETPGDAVHGLDLMRFRAHTIGAELTIESDPGNGVTITCCLPSG